MTFGQNMLIYIYFYSYTRSLSDETRWQVRLGVFSRASSTFEPYYQEFKVKKIIQHPNYMSNTLQNDIALMFVDGVIQETNGVSPACVTREMYTAGENCVTLGWGVTAHGILQKMFHVFSFTYF
jgi:hypothetical protein